jgi:hypothetical protein
MELHQLRYFCAVARTGNFTRAAENQHIAQPSLSQQIHKLEDELGARLFDRLPRFARLTESGKAFLPRAETILRRVDEARTEIQGKSLVEVGTVYVGSIPTIAYEVQYESWIEVLPFPFKDFTSQADHQKGEEPVTLFPNHDSIIVNIPIRAGMTQQEMARVRTLDMYVCVRIRVEHKDFLSVKRFVNFGFYVMGTGLGFLPKYNDVGH